MPFLYIKLGIAAAIIALLGWHLFGDYKTARDLEAARAALVVADLKIKNLEDNFVAVTNDLSDYKKAKEDADAKAKILDAEYQSILKKFKNQKPPTSCPAAIDWSIANKEDLSWDAK